MKTRLAWTTLFIAALPAFAQTFSTSTSTSGTTLTLSTTYPAITLTTAGAQYARNKLQAYATQRAARLPSKYAAMSAGLSAEADVVERAWLENGRYVMPHHVGRARTVTPTARSTDPAAEEGARAAARVKLGRDPTAADVAAELVLFDQRVAALNQQLANHRADISYSYRTTGSFPRELEATWLGVAPRSAQMRSPDATTKSGLQRAVTKLFNSLAVSP